MTGVDAFTDLRPYLFSLAYRLLGSAADAEDMLQEAFVRWQAAPRADVASPKAYLATVVTRLCLDELKSARARRETYIGPWLPEPIRSAEPSESISLAFMVLLETLTPLERAAWILHEAFDYSHAEIAAILDKGEAAVRQLVHRAREHVKEGRPRFAPSRAAHAQLLVRFISTCATGSLDELASMLAADATVVSDGGGRVQAARRVVAGAHSAARMLKGLTRRAAPTAKFEVADINGWPAIVGRDGDRTFLVLTIETDGTVVHAVRMVLNPDKLARL